MATKSKAKPEARPAGNIPAGFERTQSGSFPPNHDFKAHPILQGRVVEIRSTPQKRGKKTEEVKILYVAESDTGEIVAVWESFALESLFAQVKKGDEIFLRFNGVKKMKGKKTLKDFDAAIKPSKK